MTSEMRGIITMLVLASIVSSAWAIGLVLQVWLIRWAWFN